MSYVTVSVRERVVIVRELAYCVRALRVERDALSRGSMFLISSRPVARTGYYRDTPTRTKLLRGFLRSRAMLGRGLPRWKR